MRTGVRIGVDVGKARIGVARSDPHGMLALPVATVPRGDGDIAAILGHAAEFEATEIIVGLPLSLGGGDTPSTGDARAFGALIAERAPLTPVRLVDERLSTVSAQNALRATGRTVKNSRQIIDQVAAVIILQHALDYERSSGKAPGTIIVPAGG
ncbi:MAG: Holliday junction resolvase RuvX [Burkholderiaceae bacterium]|nr:Holliday junction resolvase RuvX [Microbacteriaceae bacterium]